MFLNLNLSQWLILLQVSSLISATILILVQQRGASIGGAFGRVGEVYLTKRGIEKWVVNLTVVMIALFVIFRLAILFV
jgi:preprotein translocase subunit SecG